MQTVKEEENNSTGSSSSSSSSSSSNSTPSSASAEDVESWLNSCKVVADWFNKNGTTYDLTSYSPYGPLTGETRTNCGYGVLACLKVAGYKELNVSAAADVARKVYQDLGWEVITNQSDVKSGDIVFMTQPRHSKPKDFMSLLKQKTNIGSGYHVQVKIKDGQYYNWGSSNAMRNNPRNISESYVAERFICGLRFKPVSQSK